MKSVPHRIKVACRCVWGVGQRAFRRITVVAREEKLTGGKLQISQICAHAVIELLQRSCIGSFKSCYRL